MMSSYIDAKCVLRDNPGDAEGKPGKLRIAEGKLHSLGDLAENAEGENITHSSDVVGGSLKQLGIINTKKTSRRKLGRTGR